MPLDTPGLESTIQSLLQDTVDNNKSISNLAGQLATAIETYVKTGTVMTTVTTAGSATAQTGTGTGNII